MNDRQINDFIKIFLKIINYLNKVHFYCIFLNKCKLLTLITEGII